MNKKEYILSGKIVQVFKLLKQVSTYVTLLHKIKSSIITSEDDHLC